MGLQIFFKEGSFQGQGKLGKFSKDSLIITKKKNKFGVECILAAVADDSGPFPDGSHASEIAINMLSEFFNSPLFTNLKSSEQNPQIEERFRDLFHRINHLVYMRGLQDGQLVKLSVSAVISVEDQMYICHIGTGSILKIEGKKAHRLVGGWNAEPILQKESLNKIFTSVPNVMGLGEKINPEFVMSVLNPSDTVVIFTDGIGEFIPDEEIKVIFNSVDTLQGACNRLVSISKERGLKDNASIVAFSMEKGKADTSKEIGDIVDEEHKKRGCSCSALYIGIVSFLLIVMVISSYIGFQYAKKLSKNLKKATPSPTPKAHPGLYPTGRYFIVLDEKTVPLTILRLNGKKLNKQQNKFEIFDTYNQLEILPELEDKELFSITINLNSKNYYDVYEGSTRNIIRLYEDNTKIFLTKGAVAKIYPEVSLGVSSIKVEGLVSPVEISFQKQNIIVKVEKQKIESP